MNKKRLGYLLIVAGVVFLLAAFALVVTGPAKANGKNHDNVPGNECVEGKHTYNPHCYVSPTVSPEPTDEVTPTQEPEVSPTDTPTPTDETHEVGQPGNPLVDTNQCTIKDCSTHTTVPKAPPSTGYPSCDVPRTCGYK